MGEYGFLVVALIAAIAIVRYFLTTTNDQEVEKSLEERRKTELKDLIENREERLDKSEFDEATFWNLIDQIRERSGDNYFNGLGLFKDFFSKYDQEDLIKLDNLIARLFRENISHEIHAASTIIFKSSEFPLAFVLMNIFMLRGQVFFKQACQNPELIIGKSIEDADKRLFHDVIAELYTAKTRKLIPIPQEEEYEIKGTPWKEKELPSRFNKLWMEFA